MTVTEEKTEGRSPKRKRDWKGLFTEWGIGLAAVAALTFICNIIGYSGGFLEAVPGLLILCVISVLGLVVKEFMPGDLPAVTYIGIIGMLAAMPASPVYGVVIYWTDKIDLMASITPILTFAGVLLGKDWKAFLKIGWKGILVSVLTIFGTFFLSGWIAEMLGKIL